MIEKKYQWRFEKQSRVMFQRIQKKDMLAMRSEKVNILFGTELG
jgi:CCR4-NOT transcriptional regulation complex NOT5 subunit